MSRHRMSCFALWLALLLFSADAGATDEARQLVTLRLTLGSDAPVVVSIAHGALIVYRSYRITDYRVGLIARVGESDVVAVDVVEVSGLRGAWKPERRVATLNLQLGQSGISSAHRALPLVVQLLEVASSIGDDDDVSGKCTLSCGDAEVAAFTVETHCGSCSAP